MADYNQLKTRAQQVRDEQTIGGNTALRVGQLLMDMVDAESETVDNIVELFTGTEDNPVIPTLPNPGLLHWLQSPIVALVSMGEDLDGDAGAVVQEGDLYYYNHSGYQIFVKGSGSLPGTGYKARQKVLYLNKYTGKLYEWTGADMSEIVLAGTGGGGNVTIEEGQYYIDITIDDNVPVIEVSTQSIVMSGDNKTATFTVSGHNLTAPIKINGGNAYFSKSPSSISPVGGIVEATTVTVTFGGTNDDTDDLIVSSVGAASKTIHVTYTAVAGPTILADSTLTIKAAAGQSNTGQLAVTGLNLTAGITATVSGTGFTVSSSESGTYGNQASLPSSGGTLYVKFSPTGSTGSTGTLTLSSTGATSKTVDLTGAVAVPTLTLSKSTMTLDTTVNTQATDTFSVSGSDLDDDVALTVEGAIKEEQTISYFSLNVGHYIKRNGTIGNGSDWRYSDLIVFDDFITTTNMMIPNGQAASVAFYAADGTTFKGYYSPSSNETVTKAILDTYLEGQSYADQVKYIRLSNGSPYETYFKYKTYESTDASDKFSVSPASISEVDGEASGTVTVGFTPSAAGSYSGKVTVSSGSISEEVTISGTAS